MRGTGPLVATPRLGVMFTAGGIVGLGIFGRRLRSAKREPRSVHPRTSRFVFQAKVRVADQLGHLGSRPDVFDLGVRGIVG